MATSSRSLAFTGPGGGLRLVGVFGVVLIVLGVAMLVLVDAPRRALAHLVPAVQRMRPPRRLRPAGGRRSAARWRRVKDGAAWMLGR